VCCEITCFEGYEPRMKITAQCYPYTVTELCCKWDVWRRLWGPCWIFKPGWWPASFVLAWRLWNYDSSSMSVTVQIQQDLSSCDGGWGLVKLESPPRSGTYFGLPKETIKSQRQALLPAFHWTLLQRHHHLELKGWWINEPQNSGSGLCTVTASSVEDMMPHS
jgi:hypothetical protein